MITFKITHEAARYENQYFECQSFIWRSKEVTDSLPAVCKKRCFTFCVLVSLLWIYCLMFKQFSFQVKMSEWRKGLRCVFTSLFDNFAWMFCMKWRKTGVNIRPTEFQEMHVKQMKQVMAVRSFIFFFLSSNKFNKEFSHNECLHTKSNIRSPRFFIRLSSFYVCFGEY